MSEQPPSSGYVIWVAGSLLLLPLLYYIAAITDLPWLDQQLDKRRGWVLIAAVAVLPLLFVLKKSKTTEQPDE
jgi:hypothetical protein